MMNSAPRDVAIAELNRNELRFRTEVVGVFLNRDRFSCANNGNTSTIYPTTQQARCLQDRYTENAVHREKKKCLC